MTEFLERGELEETTLVEHGAFIRNEEAGTYGVDVAVDVVFEQGVDVLFGG